MKTFPMKNEIGVFCQCALIYTKPAENTRGPAPRLCCGDPGRGKGGAPPRSRFKACKQNFSFIQAAKGRRSGEARRKRTTERDAEVVRRVFAGESMRSVAREFGLRLFTVQHIVSRGDQ